jgi:FKBP-type peptidyl-prolyl cis-trans isomerase FkpA
MKQLTAIAAIILLLSSCNQYEKTKTGMPYKLKKGSGAKLKQGQFVKFNIEFKTDKKDSILNSSYTGIPAYMMYDTAQLGKYNFTEVLPKMGVGDKLEFSLSNDTLKNMGMIPEFNATFPKGGLIKGRAEILAVFNDEVAARADIEKETNNFKEKEIKQLETYAKNKGLKTQKTAKGAFVVVENAGDLTNKADSGKQVSIKYRGYTEDGKEFDGNIGKPDAKPFTFVVGTRSVITGWDDALPYFGKGGKGKILVPSMLGYGQQGSPPAIKPFTNLIFDVEVADCSVPPPPAATPNTQQALPVAPQGKK